MSGLRDFVTGSDMCTASDGAGPSNAVSALVNQLLGGSSKTQEQLRDVSVRTAACLDVRCVLSLVLTLTLQGCSCMQLPMHQGMAGSSSSVGMTPEMAATAASRGTPGIVVPGIGAQAMVRLLAVRGMHCERMPTRTQPR
jgi:hypothetical protein